MSAFAIEASIGVITNQLEFVKQQDMQDRLDLNVVEDHSKLSSTTSKMILIFKRNENSLVVRRSRVLQSACLRFLSVLSGEVD